MLATKGGPRDIENPGSRKREIEEWKMNPLELLVKLLGFLRSSLHNSGDGASPLVVSPPCSVTSRTFPIDESGAEFGLARRGTGSEIAGADR